MMTLILMLALQSEGSSTLVTVRNADTYRLPTDLASAVAGSRSSRYRNC